jgi:hypothetical protein
MPAWGVTALAHGYDSPLLRELAGTQDEPRTVRDLFTGALAELGAPDLSERQAWWVMAHTYARSIVAGLVPPEEGAELLWQVSSRLDLPPELLGMLDEATDWAFAWEVDREEILRGILREAEELLSVVTLETLDRELHVDREPR